MNAFIDVLDDRVSVGDQLLLKDIISATSFPWFYDPVTVVEPTLNNTNKFQFVHWLVDKYKTNSAYSDKILKFFQFLPEFKTHKLQRCKLNLNFPYKERDMEFPHIDSDDLKTITYLYYVNQSDGPTKFYPDNADKIEIEGKMGRLVKFPSSLLHSSTLPYDYDRRIVLNLVFGGGRVNCPYNVSDVFE